MVKIKQILAAPENLYAFFRENTLPERVVCLALYEHSTGETGVSGMIPCRFEGLVFAEDVEHFDYLGFKEDQNRE